MVKTVNQGCGERWDLQARQDQEESQDSKGKLVMLASPDRRVRLDQQVPLELQAGQGMRVIQVPQDLKADLDPLAILDPLVKLDRQDLLVLKEWV